MRNPGLEEAQVWIKIAGRNINSLRYADDTTLMAESKEELKSLVMKVKEESEKTDLKLNIQKTKIMASGPISSVQFSSVTQSCLTLRPHGLQHTRPLCPSPTLRACSNSCPSSRWCHPTISSSVIPFSYHLQSFLASGSFPMSQFFASDGQRVSASASVLLMNSQDWFSLGWTGWISFQPKGLSRVFSTPQFKSSLLRCSAFFYVTVQLAHTYMTTVKTTALTRWIFVGKAMSLLFNMLSTLVIAFLPRSKCLLISWLQSPSVVIWRPPKKVSHCFHCFPIYLLWSDGTGCHDLSFLNVEF